MTRRPDIDSVNHNPYPEGFSKSVVPAGKHGTAEVQKLSLDSSDVLMSNLRALRDGLRRRVTPPGDYTRLLIKGHLMMSDIPSEAWEHEYFVRRVTPGSVLLLNGLGLGFTLDAALKKGAKSVTVVENNLDVVKLVAPTFAGKPVEIVVADAFEYTLAKDMRYDLVWHDIWPDINSDNKPAMTRLRRKYAKRTGWQGCWGEFLMERYA